VSVTAIEDIYLQGASPEQALQAVQQMADIMLNGGGWKRLGYAPLDELCEYLVCMAHAAVDYGVRVDRKVLAELFAYVAANRTPSAAGTGGGA